MGVLVAVRTSGTPVLPAEFAPVLPSHAYDAADDTPADMAALQTAVNAAVPGRIIELSTTATTTYSGKLNIPANVKGTSGNEIIIRSAGFANLPAAGTRVRISDLTNDYMAKIEGVGTGNGGIALRINPSSDQTGGASHIWFVGIAVTTDQTDQAGTVSSLAYVGSDGTADPDDECTHIVFDRCSIHGHTGNNTGYGLRLNAQNSAIIESQVREVHNPNTLADGGTGIHGHNYTGPILIRNNYVEASGIVVMTGGTQHPVNELMHPRDVVIRGNHITKNSGLLDTVLATFKNCIETKFTRRCLIENNVIEVSPNDEVGGGQVGCGVLIKTSPTAGKEDWEESVDFTVRWNVIRHCEMPIRIQGSGTSFPGRPTERISFTDNLCYAIHDVWNSNTGTNQGVWLRHNLGARWWFIERNTFVASDAAIDSGNRTGETEEPFTTRNLIIRDNIFDCDGGGWEQTATEGTAIGDTYGDPYTCEYNVFQGRDSADYPAAKVGSTMANNYFPANRAAIQFEDNPGTWDGTHTGGTSATVLTDSTQAWTIDDLIGRTVVNVTDGSRAVITDNTATTVTVAALLGGVNQDFESGDVYLIVPTNLADFALADGGTYVTSSSTNGPVGCDIDTLITKVAGVVV